ncbi:hypothetical protein, partial [Amycolatopsis taiwanensis]|uniref:hypothetical protein n=1 Tax=Amycolatopsis taiwanensis TaxID=342230 RepID=UPI0025554E21
TMRSLDLVLGRVGPTFARRHDGHPSSRTVVLLTRCPLTGGNLKQADAEHHMVTGRVYLGGDKFHGRDFFSGADEALSWALGR